ncbi:MAG: hypothetical protein WBQ20_16265 [Methyloceanibacter sp.]
MKGLMFLSLVGAAIYALLVYTNDALKDGNAEITYAGQAQSNHTVGEHFSSWDAYLPTPAVSQNSQSANSQQGDDASQDSERQLDGRHQLATSEGAQAAGRDSSEPQTVSVEWVKVVLAAKMHDQASVSFPRSGSIPQARIKREGSWFLVSDPITQEQGWVLDEYLSSSGATSSQAALESTTEPPSTKAASPKSKKLSQSSKRSKPAVRVSNPRSAKPAFRSREVTGWDPWNIPWARRVDRRRGFEPFLLGRFAQGR